MLTVDNIEVTGLRAAIRGMRNPLNSWPKSDSHYQTVVDDNGRRSEFVLGNSDLELMRKLYHAGTEHRKYMRFMVVTFDVVAPLYLLKELDTYKVGTVCNSCSTMHTIHTREFREGDFSVDELDGLCAKRAMMATIIALNRAREDYLACVEWLKRTDISPALREQKAKQKKRYWKTMIQLLPSSYNQRRTYQMSYETLAAIYRQRKGHKLTEWATFIEFIEGLPYFMDIVREVEG